MLWLAEVLWACLNRIIGRTLLYVGIVISTIRYFMKFQLTMSPQLGVFVLKHRRRAVEEPCMQTDSMRCSVPT